MAGLLAVAAEPSFALTERIPVAQIDGLRPAALASNPFMPSLHKQASPEQVAAGESITFTITLDNSSPLTLSQVVVTDHLEPFLRTTTISTTIGRISLTDRSVIVEAKAVPPRSRLVIRISANVLDDVAPGEYFNIAELSSAEESISGAAAPFRILAPNQTVVPTLSPVSQPSSTPAASPSPEPTAAASTATATTRPNPPATNTPGGEPVALTDTSIPLAETGDLGANESIEISDNEFRILLIMLALDVIILGWLIRRSRLRV